MALAFRNLTIAPDAPVSQWPTEAVQTALERGDLADWHRITTEIQADPWVRLRARWRKCSATHAPTASPKPWRRCCIAPVNEPRSVAAFGLGSRRRLRRLEARIAQTPEKSGRCGLGDPSFLGNLGRRL